MPIIRKQLSNPCCDDALNQYRINSDGVAQVSTDGGATYHDLPVNGSPLDPGTAFPPVTGASVAEIRCKVANSVTGFFQRLEANYHQALVDEVNDIALAAIFEGALLLVGIGAFTIWAAIGTTIALLVAKKNADDFAAEFTTDFWNELCNRAYCDCDAAGVYINTDPRQIIDEVSSSFSGYAADWLNDALGTMNGKDLTNIGAVGYDAGIDCSSFSCECGDLEFFIHAGSLVSQDTNDDGDCVLVVDSAFTGSHDDMQIFWNSTDAPVLTHNATVTAITCTLPIGGAGNVVFPYFNDPTTNALTFSSTGGLNCGTGELLESNLTGGGHSFRTTLTVHVASADCS
jgi:hypothetical protein